VKRRAAHECGDVPEELQVVLPGAGLAVQHGAGHGRRLAEHQGVGVALHEVGHERGANPALVEDKAVGLDEARRGRGRIVIDFFDQFFQAFSLSIGTLTI
jgi:hypothetical protein